MRRVAVFGNAYAESASPKRVHHLRSRAEIEAFVDRVGRERSSAMGRG
jgi:hypothetical protein